MSDDDFVEDYKIKYGNSQAKVKVINHPDQVKPCAVVYVDDASATMAFAQLLPDGGDYVTTEEERAENKGLSPKGNQNTFAMAAVVLEGKGINSDGTPIPGTWGEADGRYVIATTSLEAHMNLLSGLLNAFLDEEGANALMELIQLAAMSFYSQDVIPPTSVQQVLIDAAAISGVETYKKASGEDKPLPPSNDAMRHIVEGAQE